jgi:uncharacterized membrane protein
LPHFVEEAVADMSREPPYIVANAYHLFTYNGIQVQLVLQRDDKFVNSHFKPSFKYYSALSTLFLLIHLLNLYLLNIVLHIQINYYRKNLIV